MQPNGNENQHYKEKTGIVSPETKSTYVARATEGCFSRGEGIVDFSRWWTEAFFQMGAAVRN